MNNVIGRGYRSGFRKYPLSLAAFPALLCLSLSRPVLLDQLLRQRPNSFVLIFEGQDEWIDRSRGGFPRPGFEGPEPDTYIR